VTEVISPPSTEVQLLSRQRIFASLDAAEIAELARSLRRRTYKKGEVVYHQEDPPGSLFFVSKGIVKMQLVAPNGKHLTIAWIRPGSFFGTISFLQDNVRPENAVALEACDLYVLGREQFRSFLRQHPDVMEVLLEILASRWRGSIDRLRDLVFLDVPGRIAKLIVEFSQRPDETGSEGASLLGRLTQHELASLAATSRESVNKWLQFFARQGWIEVRQGRIRVLDAEALDRRILSE
jgi:CRP-like cAMP-binding protein